MGCIYEQWSRTKQAIVPCGRKSGTDGNLCSFHHDFVEDCQGSFSKRKGAKYLTDLEWTREVKRVHGVITFSSFMSMLPSDAGQDYKFGKPVNTKRLNEKTSRPINIDTIAFNHDRSALLDLITKANGNSIYSWA